MAQTVLGPSLSDAPYMVYKIADTRSLGRTIL
jgi:hypothetical protein